MTVVIRVSLHSLNTAATRAVFAAGFKIRQGKGWGCRVEVSSVDTLLSGVSGVLIGKGYSGSF